MNNSLPTTMGPTTTPYNSITTFISSNAPATNSYQEPEEVEGRDPDYLTLYPGSIRTVYIIPTCECSPSVFNQYAVPAHVEVVFNYYLEELEKMGWNVITLEKTAFSLNADKEGRQPIGIQCYKSDQWPSYNSEITIIWITKEGYIGY